MTIPETRLRQLSELLTRTAFEGSSGICVYPTQLIGEGGQGWVYRAGYDETEGPWVVVKVLRPDVVNEEALARFLREADVLRKLGQAQAPSPNVVRFYDHGIQTYRMPDGEVYTLPFTVIEYVDGRTLAEVLASGSNKGLAVARVRRIFRQTARALSLIHAAQLVHRDLKPSNLMLATEATQEVVKITDFGLVKRFDVDGKGTMSLAGASVGYAPPEQFELGNRRVSPRTDLFSFAVVLYEALTGQAAFDHGQVDSPFQILSRVLSGPRPTLLRHQHRLGAELAERPDLIARLDQEFDRATQADPAARHDSVLAFWEPVEAALRASVERTGAGASKPPTTRPGERPVSQNAPSEPRPPQSSMIGTPPPRPVAGGSSGTSGERPSVRVDVASLLPPGVASINRDPPSSSPVFSLRPGALLPERAQQMALTPDGRTLYALGRFGLVRSSGGYWSANLLPASIDLPRVRGLLVTPGGQVVVYGERGLFWGQQPDGSFVPWAAPDQDVTWTHASLIPHPAEILLLGEHTGQQRTLLGTLRPGQALACRLLDRDYRLQAAARLVSGLILACGEGGELVALGNGPPEPISWGRTGQLAAVLPAPDGGAHVVGHGGHALHVTATREARLEPVQTTRDLVSLAMGHSAVPWAGGQDARLLRRTLGGWIRIPLDASIQGTIRALTVTPTALLVATDEGRLVEGALT